MIEKSNVINITFLHYLQSKCKCINGTDNFLIKSTHNTEKSMEAFQNDSLHCADKLTSLYEELKGMYHVDMHLLLYCCYFNSLSFFKPSETSLLKPVITKLLPEITLIFLGILRFAWFGVFFYYLLLPEPVVNDVKREMTFDIQKECVFIKNNIYYTGRCNKTFQGVVCEHGKPFIFIYLCIFL